jgi:hypothetical protein
MTAVTNLSSVLQSQVIVVFPPSLSSLGLPNMQGYAVAA